MRCDKKPFTDINVRKALNLAVDRKTIAETYCGGLVDGQPTGMIYPGYTGWCYPHSEWPQEMKDEYAYNPEKAKKMLADAGYPNGFKTNAVGTSTADTQLMQIIKAYFMDVGVDLEIRLMDFVAANEFTRAGKHDQACFGESNNPHIPSISIGAFQSGNTLNLCHVDDPAYEAMGKKFQSAVTMDDAKKVSRELDEYYLKQHWRVDIFPTLKFVSWQPYIKGYSGEQLHLTNNFYWARLWIDR